MSSDSTEHVLMRSFAEAIAFGGSARTWAEH